MMYKPLYFSERECNKCTPSFSLRDVDEGVWIALDKARNFAGMPIVLNCGFRSKEWDVAHGRKYNNGIGCSYHSLGLAVDIRCRTSENRYRLVNALLFAGFTGIGVYDTFIHADMRSNPLMFIGQK